ncbi:MAG: zinc ribbon domain-containing protein [Candidatus Hermodarchaeota archaeon]
MAKFCVYCGKPVKSSDKFCINCGKPLLSSLPKTEKKPIDKIIEEPVKEDNIQETSVKEKKIEEKEEEVEEEEEEKIAEDKEEKKKEIQPLPDEVKQQIDYYLELNDIRMKKSSLDDKLKDLQKELKSDKYETDFGYGEKINVQLKAVKTVMEELKQQENEVKEKITDKFIVEKLDFNIETKKAQLKNLVREHKLKKIKNKEVVKKLKDKYKDQLETFIDEQAELIAGIQLWIDELIEEKEELKTERTFNKARFSSKEISENEYKENDLEFENKIKKIESKIKTLSDLTKKKK